MSGGGTTGVAGNSTEGVEVTPAGVVEPASISGVSGGCTVMERKNDGTGRDGGADGRVLPRGDALWCELGEAPFVALDADDCAAAGVLASNWLGSCGKVELTS